MSVYSTSIEKMESQLTVWDAQIKLLDAKIASAGADVKRNLAGELDDLRIKRGAATEAMTDLKKAQSETWEQVKGTADKIWDDLKTGIAKVHSRIN